MGDTLIYISIGFLVAGITYKFGLLGWFGNLPGDINYKSEHTFVFIPITSMLIVSGIFSLLMWFMQR